MSALVRLRDYQTAAIREIYTKWDAGVTRPAVVLPTGAGKGSTLSTEVPTPSGLRLWGDLQVGDQVFGSDGQPTEVTAIYDRGAIPAYRVTFSDGASVEVDGEHLWAIRDAQYRRTSRERRVVETQVIAASNLKMDRGYRWRIPMCGAVDRKSANLPIDPYVIGALIANGTLGGDGTVLTTPDRQVIDRVMAATPARDVSVAGYCDRIYLHGLTGVTRDLGMKVKSGQKRIPRIYLEGSIEQRIDLLHGLMDGDGSARDNRRRSVRFHTTSEGLSGDVQELVTSLGGTANLQVSDRSNDGKPTEYNLGISLPSGISPFWSTRKADAGTQSIRNLQPRRAIVNIELIGNQPIRCITVAAANSLYLITRQHIVTHNTVVFTHLAERFLRANPGKRVLILAHTDELVQQAKNKMHEVAPNRMVGVVKAAQNEVHAEIVVASVQSLRSKARRDKIKAVGLVIVDECHHASARTYMNILEHYGAIFPEVDGVDTRVRSNFGPTLAVGFTATLVRGDDKKLSDVWQDVAFRLSIAFMIRAGYLLDVKGKRVEVPELDLKKVHTSGGDYKEGELADALVEAMAPQIVAKKYLEHASDRKGIGFAPTVDSAYIFSDAFRDLGITSEVVHGKLEKQERRDILLRLKSGETQVCWSVMALTEGFDEPTVSCAIMARPTKSSGLWQQMVGRVLRPDLSLPPDERGHALLLDVTGAGRLHGLQSLVDLSAREDLPENVDEDLSLLELEDLILDEEPESEGVAEPTMYYMGPATTVEFDPLGRDSDRSWGRTPDGHFYLAAGTNGYIFLTESLKGEPGSYDLVWCDATSARMTEHTEVHFEMGIAWGEEMAIELGGFGSKTLTAKKAKWRNDPATKGQAYKVRQVPGWGGAKIRTVREDPLDQFSEVKEYRIGTPGGEILTKGKASEIIDGHAAAQRIDPLVRAVRASLS